MGKVTSPTRTGHGGNVGPQSSGNGAGGGKVESPARPSNKSEGSGHNNGLKK